MAVSGSTDFALNANQIIAAAFKKLGVGTEGEALTAAQYEDGRLALNLLIKTWGAQPHLWTQTEAWLPYVAGQSGYALNAAMRVLSVRRRLTSGTIDTPMTPLSRQEYFDLPNKTTQAVPVNYYFDPQYNTSTLYVWPTASAATAAAGDLRITYLRRMCDMDTTTDDLDMPQEWLEAVIYNLAVRLMPTYPVNDPNIAARVESMAGQLYAALKGWDNETTSLFLQPDNRWC